MAERTGVPELDALIVEFGWQAGAPESASDDGTIDWLRHPDEAEGYCGSIADEFADFLTGREIDAYGSGRHAGLPPAEYPHAQRNPFYGGSHDADAFGYRDRTRSSSYDQHALTVIHWQDEIFLVDWAAAQFGYREFPLVQKRAGDAWLRDWI